MNSARGHQTGTRSDTRSSREPFNNLHKSTPGTPTACPMETVKPAWLPTFRTRCTSHTRSSVVTQAVETQMTVQAQLKQALAHLPLSQQEVRDPPQTCWLASWQNHHSTLYNSIDTRHQGGHHSWPAHSAGWQQQSPPRSAGEMRSLPTWSWRATQLNVSPGCLVAWWQQQHQHPLHRQRTQVTATCVNSFSRAKQLFKVSSCAQLVHLLRQLHPGGSHQHRHVLWRHPLRRWRVTYPCHSRPHGQLPCSGLQQLCPCPHLPKISCQPQGW